MSHRFTNQNSNGFSLESLIPLLTNIVGLFTNRGNNSSHYPRGDYHGIWNDSYANRGHNPHQTNY